MWEGTVSARQNNVFEGHPRIYVCLYRDRCTFGQSYTEGSSWNAYKVKDKVWIGYHESKTESPLAATACTYTFG